MTGASKNTIVMIAPERIRKQFEAQQFTVAGHTLGATASFGIASFRETSSDFRDLVSRADAALYSAKHKGRNRVEFAME